MLPCDGWVKVSVAACVASPIAPSPTGADKPRERPASAAADPAAEAGRLRCDAWLDDLAAEWRQNPGPEARGSFCGDISELVSMSKSASLAPRADEDGTSECGRLSPWEIVTPCSTLPWLECLIDAPRDDELLPCVDV